MTRRYIGTPGFSRPVEERFWEKVDKRGDSECWLWKGVTNGWGRYGFFTMKMNSDGTRVVAYAHRAAWTLVHGPIPKGMKVLHRCDNPSCVNPDHLFLGTQKTNMADMVRKGRAVGGRQHKLSFQLAENIRGEYASKQGTLEQLGRKYGVHLVTIWEIVHRKIWREPH